MWVSGRQGHKIGGGKKSLKGQRKKFQLETLTLRHRFSEGPHVPEMNHAAKRLDLITQKKAVLFRPKGGGLSR